MAPSNKRPKYKELLPKKSIITKTNTYERKKVLGAYPISYDSEKVCWRLGRFDSEHRIWGECNFTTANDVRDLLSKMKDYETRTWNEIKTDVGGRCRGNNSHFISIDKLCKDAQKRLEELHLDDVEELYSLRLTGTKRLFGIRVGASLEILWYDPDHSICPSIRN